MALRRSESAGLRKSGMAEKRGARELDVRTDVEVLAERACALEDAGLLDRALLAWRAVLEIDRNSLPAWEASARILGTLRREGRNEAAR